MIKHGKPPYLECSSRGDKRFSAFYAMINGRSIEQRYQAFKIFEDGSTGHDWRSAKGRKAINQKEAANFYSFLWDRYIKAHPQLLAELRAATGLSDMFGQHDHCCQATELWRIRNDPSFITPQCEASRSVGNGMHNRCVKLLCHTGRHEDHVGYEWNE